MNFEVCKNEREWIDCANDWLHQQSRNITPRPFRLFVPAGETPRPLYRSWRANPQLVDESIRLVQVDEILQNSERPFQKFFLDELPMFTPRFEFIETAEKGADFAILGLGMNGHIAFHEPRLPQKFYSGCLTLSDDTCARLHLPPSTRAVSYGANAFLKTKAIALLVRGLQKKEILKRVLDAGAKKVESERQKLPASWLLDHPQMTIITDFQV